MTDRQTSKLLLCLASLVWLTGPAGAAAAGAQGAVIAPGALPAAARAHLSRQIATARARRPAAFRALAELRGRLPQLARQQRGRMVNLVLPLRALGSEGLLPMVSELAFAATPRGSLPDRAWRGWRVSLLEAVGSLRDDRAAPVLAAILARGQDVDDDAVLRAAATALGRLGSDPAVATLARLARGPDPRLRLAAVRGLGECRRQLAASSLAAILGRRPVDAQRCRQAATKLEDLCGTQRSSRVVAQTANAAIAALGQVGNSWAWHTPAVARSGERDATRRIARDALLAAYPQLADGEREAAAKALLLISHPATFARLEAVKRGRPADEVAALEQLRVRLDRDGLLR